MTLFKKIKGVISYSSPLSLISLISLFIVAPLLSITRVGADIASTAVGMFFLLHCYLKKDYGWIMDRDFSFFLLFCLWIILSGLFVSKGIGDITVHSLIFIRYVLLLIAINHWLINNSTAASFLGIVALAVLIFLSLDVFWQFFSGLSLSGYANHGESRLTGWLGKPYVGNYLAKLIFPVLGLFVLHYKCLGYVTSLVIAACVVGIITLTGERTSSILSVAAIYFILLGSALGYKKRRLSIMVITVVLSTSLVCTFKYNSFIKNRMLTSVVAEVGKKDSLYKSLFKASLYSWQESPFLGIGMRQFRKACPAFIDKNLIHYCDIHPHNIYLEILTETGVVGLFLFVAAVFCCCRKLLINIKRQIFASNFDNKLISNLYGFAGLFVVLFPISVTTGFSNNWSATLNFLSIAYSLLLSRICYSQED